MYSEVICLVSGHRLYLSTEQNILMIIKDSGVEHNSRGLVIVEDHEEILRT